MLSTRARLASRSGVGASIRRAGNNRGLTHQPHGGSAAKPRYYYELSPDTIVLGVGLGGLIVSCTALVLSTLASLIKGQDAKIKGQDAKIEGQDRFLKGCQDLEIAVLGSKLDEDYWKDRRAAVLRGKNDEKKNDDEKNSKRFWFWPW